MKSMAEINKLISEALNSKEPINELPAIIDALEERRYETNFMLAFLPWVK